MAEKKEPPKNEFILQIPEKQEALFVKKHSTDSKASPITESPSSYSSQSNIQSSSSQELKNMSPKPPKIPTDSITRRRSLLRSEFSKPKSRLVEPPHPTEPHLIEENHLVSSYLSNRNSPNMPSSPSNKTTTTTPRGHNLNAAPFTPDSPLTESPREDDDEEDEVYKTADLEVSQRSGKKLKLMALTECIAFICIMGVLIASLTNHKLQYRCIWGLMLWKWCVLVLVILCGRIMTEWLMNILVFLIEKNFLFKKKVLYFVYGLKRSVQAFVWLGLILLAWFLLFDCGTKQSKMPTNILDYITRAIASCLIGTAIWLAKTLLIKLLASSFLSTRFFDRIQESIFHQYILHTLSGPPVIEMAEMVGETAVSGQLSFRSVNRDNEGRKEEVIDVEKLKKMKQEKVSAWTMRGLINVIRSSGLSTISNTLESFDKKKTEQKDKEITSEWEAKAAANRIFKNVAKPGNCYIDEDDLLRFMKKEEVDNVLPLFEGAVETGKIKRKSMKNWLVKVYLERKSLVHSLNDTKTAVDELNRLASMVVVVVIGIVWLLLMGFLTSKVLLFISSQLLLVGFMFNNTAKTVFEAIIFVFVMHPFDVGDRCVIDGVQMVVEEMNILTTVFLRYDNEKIFYPNSVLAAKPISNFYRSPEMSDSVEFAVDFSTSMESIGALKARIKAYLESRPQHWRPGYSVLVKDIEDVHKMKMGLYVTHTINFQNYGIKSSRRSELVIELKKIFEELDIKYHLPPQEVHLSHLGPPVSTTQPLWR